MCDMMCVKKKHKPYFASCMQTTFEQTWDFVDNINWKYTMYLNICQQMLKVASAALGQWPCISITALVYWKKQRNKETKKETKKLGEI